MNEKKHIAIYLPLLIGAGAERVMLNLANELARDSCRVDLVLGRASGSYMDQVSSQVNLVDLDAGRVLTSLPGLLKYLRESRPDAIISALDHANIVALWAHRLAGVPSKIIVSLHNTLSEKLKKAPLFSRTKTFPFFLKLFYPWADGIVAVSSGVAEDYAKIIGFSPDRIKVIYNPVVTDEMVRLSKEVLDDPWFSVGAPPVIISVGRLTEQKNYAALIQAFSHVRASRNARLLILGEGELRKSLADQVKRLGLEDDVAMPGFVANPYKYMANASVFVLSSNWEGLPTVLIEALAVGIPVVSTDCKSGPVEILSRGKFGKLVPVNDVAALSHAISSTLDIPKTPVPKEAFSRFEPRLVSQQYIDYIGVC